MQLDRRPVAAAHHREEQPERSLEAACRPARLLAAVGVDRDRQLLGHDQVFEVCGLPAAQLRAVAEVEVLGERGSAPAAGIHDGAAAPHPGGACEVREVTARRPHGLLDQEMEVDRERLQPGEPRVALVEVSPARLDESDGLVGEHADRPAQEVGRRNEVCVEDRDERRSRERDAVRERARLEPDPLLAPHVGHVQPSAAPARQSLLDDRDRVVVRVVQYLHLEPRWGPLDRADRVDHARRDVALVVDRNLHADQGLVAPRRGIVSCGPQPRRSPREEQQVHPEREQQHAGRGQHDDHAGRERGHESNSV